MAKNVPIEAFDAHSVIVGRTGSGKTYRAKSIVETWLAQARHVVVFDPTGVWHGLQRYANGEQTPYRVVVIGGNHANVPLLPGSGAALAKAIIDHTITCVIDTSELLIDERRRITEAFFETLYAASKRKPIYLVLDEADEIAPQQPLPENRRLFHYVDRIVRRGRARGFRTMMITQRPAVLHKNVMAQASTLVAMRLMAPQDRKAIEDWIRGQADEKKGRAVLESLPKLARGEGWTWAPDHDVLVKSTTPAIATLDTGATPEDGDQAHEAAPISHPDLEALLRAAAPAAKDDDREAFVPLKPVHIVTQVDGVKLRAEFERGASEAYAAAVDRACANVDMLRADLEKAFANFQDRLRAPWQGIGDRQYTAPAPLPRESRPAPPAPPKAREPGAKDARIDFGLTPPALRVLEALSWFPDHALTDDEVVTLSGLRSGNGVWYGVRKALARSTLAMVNGSTWEITTSGLQVIGETIGKRKAPPSAREIIEARMAKLKKPACRLLAQIWEVRPAAISADALSRASSLKTGNGVWYGALKDLRQARLIVDVDRSHYALSPPLQGNLAAGPAAWRSNQI